MGDKRKNVNKHFDKARTDLKLRQKRGWKFYATNVARYILVSSLCVFNHNL
jgi:hypothetical protein